ncbi:FRG domain-containing protein [Acidithiobacillus montserratensis]|uniref:FRG domain-containing protein n=1 Tax=Acidithiobacillus montserratensis TaxID=2729135 RepID=A0ACD5HG10_9PROT|nr:FRG domain-containing protein [Acidithiobacillus montserratensis]MBU2747477.1 FRG domain-containing protein [Acidithiobacillus montserratensis]
MKTMIPTGQYIGKYTNISMGLSSLICLNVDSIGEDTYEIFATIFAGIESLYTVSFSISYEDLKNKDWIKVTKIYEYERTQKSLKIKDYDQRTYSEAKVRVTYEYGLRLNWKLPDGTEGQTDGLICNQSQESTLHTDTLSWDDFHSLVNTNFFNRRYVFRGQPAHYRLRTSFHRTNRANIDRYYRENIPSLQRYISAIHPDFASLENDEKILSLLTLLQHHGYPTPILDWTLSPYIAAYFAFFYARSHEGDNVRILAFDRKGYSADFPQYNHISDMALHVSFFDTPALHNPRCIPQQSVSCISTIDDIEKYIEIQENTFNKRYLSVFSISRQETQKALNDLHLMGINHATLFPGLDGVCSYMKQAHFGGY